MQYSIVNSAGFWYEVNMKIRFEDVLDLEHLVHVDGDPDSREDALKLAERDREIYARCRDVVRDEKELLFAWLSLRKKQYEHPFPGKVFSTSISLVRYLLVFTGTLIGAAAAWSFLAYHGTQPVNVALYIFLFVALPLLFSLVSLLFRFGRIKSPPVYHMLISFLSFGVMPKLLKKIHVKVFGRIADSADQGRKFLQLDRKEYRGIFFWLFFTLTSVFGFSFSCGILGATFLKVLVSDIAFGWQSTLITASQTVYDLVSALAVPWKWLLAQGAAHPGLPQVEGSRIILKDGIEVLATGDLVSWWPFICMTVLTYAVIPRGLCILAGKMICLRKLRQLDFGHPRFSQLILRMQSPILEIDDQEETESKSGAVRREIEPEEIPAVEKTDSGTVRQAALFASKSVFSDNAVERVVQYIGQYLFLDVVQAHAITFDAETDSEKVSVAAQSSIDQVVLLQEAWQPPIRGLLFYLKQVRDLLPERISMCILLTGSAEKDDLSVSREDMNAQVWEKAVLKLKHPGIITKRML